MRIQEINVGKFIGKCQKLLFEAILKIKPESKHGIELKTFTWQDFRSVLKSVHYLYAFLTVVGVILINSVLIKVPLLNLSIIKGLSLGIQAFVTNVLHISTDVMQVTTIALICLLILWRENVGSIFGINPGSLLSSLPWFAMREELLFREGSEDWNILEKIGACLSFGLAHFTMWVVPIGTAIALSFAGGALMMVYLNTFKKSRSRLLAVKESATVHTAYNALLLAILLVVLVLWIFLTMLSSIFSLIMALM